MGDNFYVVHIRSLKFKIIPSGSGSASDERKQTKFWCWPFDFYLPFFIKIYVSLNKFKIFVNFFPFVKFIFIGLLLTIVTCKHVPRGVLNSWLPDWEKILCISGPQRCAVSRKSGNRRVATGCFPKIYSTVIRIRQNYSYPTGSGSGFSTNIVNMRFISPPIRDVWVIDCLSKIYEYVENPTGRKN